MQEYNCRRQLENAFQAGDISRREFMRIAVLLGLSLSSIIAFLTGCGSEEETEPNPSKLATKETGAVPLTPEPTLTESERIVENQATIGQLQQLLGDLYAVNTPVDFLAAVDKAVQSTIRYEFRLDDGVQRIFNLQFYDNQSRHWALDIDQNGTPYYYLYDAQGIPKRVPHITQQGFYKRVANPANMEEGTYQNEEIGTTADSDVDFPVKCTFFGSEQVREVVKDPERYSPIIDWLMNWFIQSPEFRNAVGGIHVMFDYSGARTITLINGTVIDKWQATSQITAYENIRNPNKVNLEFYFSVPSLLARGDTLGISPDIAVCAVLIQEITHALEAIAPKALGLEPPSISEVYSPLSTHLAFIQSYQGRPDFPKYFPQDTLKIIREHLVDSQLLQAMKANDVGESV